MDAVIAKHYILQIIRIIDQFCSLNKLSWQMYGTALRMLLSGKHALFVDQPLEFVINNGTRLSGLVSPVETIAQNLNINGFHIIKKDPYQAKLNAVFSHGHDTKSIHIVLSNRFPFTFFTSDTIILDSTGFSVKSATIPTDGVNACKGIALLDRMLNLQDNVLIPDTILISSNNIKCHKDHNISFLKEINAATSTGFTIKAANVDMKKQEGECPVCMDSDKMATTLSCGHSFCLGCLKTILETENTPRCSLCRTGLSFVTTTP